MKRQNSAGRRRVTIEEVYPDLTPQEREEAAARLKQYLAVVRRVYERKRKLTGPDVAP